MGDIRAGLLYWDQLVKSNYDVKFKLKNFSCDTPPYCLNSDLVTSNLAVYSYCWQLTDGWLTVYFLINSSVSYSICRISISVGELSLHTGSTWSLFWTKHLDQASQKIPLHIYSTWSLFWTKHLDQASHKLPLHIYSTWSLFWTKHLDQASQKLPLHIYSTWSKTYFFVQNI